MRSPEKRAAMRAKRSEPRGGTEARVRCRAGSVMGRGGHPGRGRRRRGRSWNAYDAGANAGGGIGPGEDDAVRVQGSDARESRGAERRRGSQRQGGTRGAVDGDAPTEDGGGRTGRGRRVVFQPGDEGRAVVEENDIDPSDGVALVNAHRSGKGAGTIVREGDLDAGAVVGGGEPGYRDKGVAGRDGGAIDGGSRRSPSRRCGPGGQEASGHRCGG